MFLTENLPLHNQVLFDLQIHRLLLGNNMNLNSEMVRNGCSERDCERDKIMACNAQAPSCQRLGNMK